MATETLPLEQVQREVVEATRECGHFKSLAPVATGRGALICSHGRQLTMCAECVPKAEGCNLCKGTGRVPLFPKAGEKCPGLGYGDHEDDPLKCRFCHGHGLSTIPTTDVGRLLDGYRLMLLLNEWWLGVGLLTEKWHVYQIDAEHQTPISTGDSATEALWRAAHTILPPKDGSDAQS